jgi:haloacid dehalogenase superfamily, subfamily IA, variant 3 with third motif having DD or ED/haloacid dehalogenase superfamily, subfamily IA, variant 1 with third motif having Dx(3-4)D or Dx(3-4)E
MSSLRLAVFDVDGTLVDSQHNILAAMSAAWKRLDLGEPDPLAVRRIIGLSLVEACAALLPGHGDAMHRATAEAYKDAFRTLRLKSDTVEPLFPGVPEALDALERRGWLLGLATGKSRRGVDAVLRNHGLEGRFVTIQTADDNPGKPDPGMLRRAAAEAGAEAAHTVMIGDTSYDMLMAAAAGAVGIGVSWGYHAVAELHEAGAHAVIDGFDALEGVVAALPGERACV